MAEQENGSSRLPRRWPGSVTGEREGRLIARPYSERPPRAACQLTAEGTELAGALRLLAH